MNHRQREESAYRLLVKKEKRKLQQRKSNTNSSLRTFASNQQGYTDMLHDHQLQRIIYGMLNYLQASPEAKARLLMQKEKRKRDSASERGIEKRQKIHLASMRAMLSHTG